MRKAVKRIYIVSLIASIIIFILLGYAEIFIPDEINLKNPQDITSSTIFTYVIKNENSSLNNENCEMNIRLFDTIPVKTATVKLNKRKYVSVCGDVFGIKMYTDGVMVVANQSIETQNGELCPGAQAKLEPGDVIKKLDGKTVLSSNDLSERIKNAKGKKVKITFERNSKEKVTFLTPVKCKQDGKYKAGLWVRDSTAGIGTVTFFDRESKVFAALGHAVCDIDTGFEMPISDGDAVEATVSGCYKSKVSSPGELIGMFKQRTVGKLFYNGNTGIYGMFDKVDNNAKIMPVALIGEVETGKAKILTTVDENGPQYYDIEIVRAYKSNSTVKNMVVEITDKRLLEKTGGIVQGMSGTPIIQNGMLVGAVTHVFVNNPKQGYAIFAENMIETAQSVANENKLKNVS